MRFVKHVEGATSLLVPALSLTRVPPPTSPVFFNPAASLNRDVSVAITEATGGSTFCDAMSGVGARGVRVAKEVGHVKRVALVDINKGALRAARRSSVLNRVAGKCEFSSSETRSYLFSRYSGDEKFDYVDLDPFGTPVRRLQAGVWATSAGGVLSVTATDTAVLCGVYPRVSRRRYGASSLSCHFSHETGIRVLIGALARAAAQMDTGVEPVFAHSTRHYIRVFVKVNPGASRADEALGRLGYVTWCPHCGTASVSESLQSTCSACGKRAKVAGPLWVQGLTAPRVLKEAAEAAAGMGLASAARLIRSVEGLDGFPPWSYSIEKASSSLGVATVPEQLVLRHLAGGGWKAMRTPFEKTGIKSDASYADFLSAVKSSMSSTRAEGLRPA